jgi:hypothetical protein
MNASRRSVVLLLASSACAASLGAFAAKPEKAPKPDHKDKAAPDRGPDQKPEHGKGHAKKAKHSNGKQLVGDKIKHNGRHAIDHKGSVTSEIDVDNGKISGFHAKHAKKGDLSVTKYKSKQQMAEASAPSGPPRLMTVQDEYLGTMWIGYSYWDDEYEEEVIYWFPYDMIADGDTGAIWYEPAV